MDAAEIQKLIFNGMNAAQRELEGVKPLMQIYMKLGAYADELERRTREMNLLRQMGELLLSCLSPAEAYDVVQQQAQEIVPAKVGALYISTGDAGTARLRREAVWGECLLAVPEFAAEGCWAWRRNRVHAVRDAGSGILCKHIHYAPANGCLCLPLMAHGKTLGVLHLVHAEGDRETDAARQLAVVMGEHLSLALANLMKQESLYDQAMHDHLTRLYNRRFMEEFLKISLNDAARHEQALGVIWLDIDRFKDFNTQFTAAGGDAVLREVGNLLMKSIRGHDIPCRYGGDEYVLIMPGANERIAGGRAQLLCDEIRRKQVYLHGQALGRITAAIGVAVFPGRRLTAEELLAEGDTLLQAAEAAAKESKATGGDRVTIAPLRSENRW
jgi:diguanylate cyclase (GGDEF)-like protein